MKKLSLLFCIVLIMTSCSPLKETYQLFVDSETGMDEETAFESQEIPEMKNLNFKPRYADSYIIDVECINQFPLYPAGCETVSTIMALRKSGEMVDIDEFINIYLPKSSSFYTENGKNYGPDPFEFYVGIPYDKYSWGCMAPVMEKALISYFGSSERVLNTSGIELQDLCHEYVANSIPVIVWVTIGMKDIVWEFSWYLSDGSLYKWPGNEHCMLLVGYDEENYYFNDPYSGYRRKYPKERVELRYKEMGMQSIVTA